MRASAPSAERSSVEAATKVCCPPFMYKFAWRSICHYRPIAAFRSLFKLPRCGATKRPLAHCAAFCRLERRCA
jgi:hypothetical protein